MRFFQMDLEYDPETKKYQAYLGAVNCRMARKRMVFMRWSTGFRL